MSERIVKPGEQGMILLSFEDFASMVSMRLLQMTNDINTLMQVYEGLKQEVDKLKQQNREGVKE